MCFPIGHIDNLKDPTLPIASPTSPIDNHTNNQNENPNIYNYKDIEFILKLMKLIEYHGIPAPAPIEQRWTASSPSYMSPSYSIDKGMVYCWVGIIMYLPNFSVITANDAAHYKIMHMFQQYITKCIRPLLVEYNATPHWGKVVLPKRRIHTEYYYNCLKYYNTYMKDVDAIYKCNKRLYNQIHTLYHHNIQDKHEMYRYTNEDIAIYKQLNSKFPLFTSVNQITYKYILDLFDKHHITTNHMLEELLSIENKV